MDERTLTYTFGCGPLPAAAVSPACVGNKAANLIRMAEAGLPIPAGFVISTDMCRDYFDRGGRLPEDVDSLLSSNLAHIERSTGRRFGGQRHPLLVSVRSGAPASMPGMMDTILNVGLCDQTVPPLLRLTGNPRFVWDSYRRLVQAYAEVVRGIPAAPFDRLLRQQLQQESVPDSGELDVFALRALTQQFLDLYASRAGEPFPQDPLLQLSSAVAAVFRSWRGSRAVEYRRMHNIAESTGTAVTVQTMVFGNMGSTSGSGVAFTRDPTTGAHQLYLDFLWNAQGEDVVSGRFAVQDIAAFRRFQPALDDQLRQIGHDLERLFRDAQDFEFTIQDHQLFLLQSRAAKRTPWAALQIACDLVNEGLIDTTTALQRLADYDLDALRIVRLASERNSPPLAAGVAACPGVAVGQIALDPQVALTMSREGRHPILVRQEISTDDLVGLSVSEGILTRLGGRTSHAAVVARQLNKVCIVGCRSLVLEQGHRCRIGSETFSEGDFVSLDGHTGEVYAGELNVVAERPVDLLAVINRWRQTAGPPNSPPAEHTSSSDGGQRTIVG